MILASMCLFIEMGAKSGDSAEHRSKCLLTEMVAKSGDFAQH